MPSPPALPRGAEIILVRHGRSAHTETRWLNDDAVRDWMRAYDAAGIADASLPPEDLVALARSAGRVVSSDLPRAVASATVLLGHADFERTPLLREAPMETADAPLPRFGGVSLPLGAWALVFGARWLQSSIRSTPPPGVDAAVLARADEAATWLTERAVADGRLVAVTHATLRAVLTKALMQRGWQGPAKHPVRTWSAWTLRAP